MVIYTELTTHGGYNMKKNIFALILAALMCCAVLLSGCSEKEPFVFNEDVMTLSDGTAIPLGSHFEATTESAVIKSYADGENVISKDVSLGGVKVGSAASDFITAFGLEKNHAMWETYTIKSADETIINYDNFTGGEISYGTYDDRFLTVGYLYTPDHTWETMDIDTLTNLWELEESIYDFGKIAIISAGFDATGTITTLIADYGEYSDFASFYEKQEIN